MTDKNRNSNAHETQHIDSNPFFLKKRYFSSYLQTENFCCPVKLKKKEKSLQYRLHFPEFYGFRLIHICNLRKCSRRTR